MVMIARACKTCRHWGHDVGRNAQGRLLPRAHAPCRWVFPDLVLPDSIPTDDSMGFRNPRPRHMSANEGTQCPTWEARPC